MLHTAPDGVNETRRRPAVNRKREPPLPDSIMRPGLALWSKVVGVFDDDEARDRLTALTPDRFFPGRRCGVFALIEQGDVEGLELVRPARVSDEPRPSGRRKDSKVAIALMWAKSRAFSTWVVERQPVEDLPGDLAPPLFCRLRRAGKQVRWAGRQGRLSQKIAYSVRGGQFVEAPRRIRTSRRHGQAPRQRSKKGALVLKRRRCASCRCGAAS